MNGAASWEGRYWGVPSYSFESSIRIISPSKEIYLHWRTYSQIYKELGWIVYFNQLIVGIPLSKFYFVKDSSRSLWLINHSTHLPPNPFWVELLMIVSPAATSASFPALTRAPEPLIMDFTFYESVEESGDNSSHCLCVQKKCQPRTNYRSMKLFVFSALFLTRTGTYQSLCQELFCWFSGLRRKSYRRRTERC